MSVFRAKFPLDGHRLWIRIHLADCNAARIIPHDQRFNVWDLEATTLDGAFAEVERTEHASERQIAVEPCPCVGGTRVRYEPHPKPDKPNGAPSSEGSPTPSSANSNVGAARG